MPSRKPCDDIRFTACHKRVHHFGDLSLSGGDSRTRSAVVTEGCLDVVDVGICGYHGSERAVELEGEVIRGDGVAAYAVLHAVTVRFEPDGGGRLVDGYLHGGGGSDVVVFTALYGHLYPIGAGGDDGGFFDVHIFAVFGSGNEDIDRALQRGCGYLIAAGGDVCTHAVGSAVKGCDVYSPFKYEVGVAGVDDDIRLRVDLGHLEEDIHAFECARKVGVIRRHGYAVAAHGADVFHAGPLLTVGEVLYRVDAHVLGGVVFAVTFGSGERLVFDAHAHLLEHHAVPRGIGCVRLTAYIQALTCVNELIVCVHHYGGRRLDDGYHTVGSFHHDFKVGVDGSIHIVDEVAANGRSYAVVFGGNYAVTYKLNVTREL